jgi:hypothetical protein
MDISNTFHAPAAVVSERGYPAVIFRRLGGRTKYSAHNGDEEKVPPLVIFANESCCVEACGSSKLRLKNVMTAVNEGFTSWVIPEKIKSCYEVKEA